MKRETFYAGRNRSGNLLHIETDGCIVNIHVGLHDADGRQVTSVRVSPDNYAEPGGRWVLDGSRVIQLLDGEPDIPRPARLTVDIPLTEDMRTPDELAAALRDTAWKIMGGNGVGYIPDRHGRRAGSFTITGTEQAS